jgi:spore maturation protein CgeB
MEDLFEPGSEIIFSTPPADLPSLVERYLNAPGDRQRVSAAARKRVLAEHTYDHRMRSLMETMRRTFG